MQSTMPRFVYAVKAECNVCVLPHRQTQGNAMHVPPSAITTPCLAVQPELFKYVHFSFSLLSSKCLLSLLMISNKLTVPEGKFLTKLRTFPARLKFNLATTPGFQSSPIRAPNSSPAPAPAAHSSPPLLFNKSPFFPPVKQGCGRP